MVCYFALRAGDLIFPLRLTRFCVQCRRLFYLFLFSSLTFTLFELVSINFHGWHSFRFYIMKYNR